MNKTSSAFLNTNDVNTKVRCAQISRMIIKNIRGIRQFAIFALSLLTLLALLVSPAATTVRAQGGYSVTASAVIVPAQVSEMSFLTTALIRDVSVEAGDFVEAGKPLAALDTPELEYLVTAAEAAYHSAQSYAELQRYGSVKKYDDRGRVYFEAPPHEAIQKADARAEQAHVALEVAQASLALSTMAAPYNGTVSPSTPRPANSSNPASPSSRSPRWTNCKSKPPTSPNAISPRSRSASRPRCPSKRSTRNSPPRSSPSRRAPIPSAAT